MPRTLALPSTIETVTARTLPLQFTRIAIAMMCGLLVGLRVSGSGGSLWIAAVAISELWTWFASRPQRHNHPATDIQRAFYFLSILFMNVVWCSLSVLLWRAPEPAFQIAAVCLLGAQLFHAQTFTSQSAPMAFVVGGFPILTLIGLACFAGQFGFAERMFLIAAVLIMSTYVAIATVMSRRRDAQLMAAQSVAEQADRAKSDLLAIVSHELRTPMYGILGVADVLRAQAATKTFSRELETIASSGREMVRLLDDLLDNAKLEHGPFSVRVGQINTVDLADGLASLWQPLAAAKGLSLCVTVSPSFPSAIKCDPGRLRQMLGNLIGNAIKFSSHGAVGVVMDTDARGAIFAVTDSGPGLDEVSREKLFQPFSQIERPRSDGTPGSGLGLYITRRIARAMGGDITMTSTPGVGSTFTLDLPLEVAVASASVEMATPAVALKASVLVVDDHHANRLVASSTLKSFGCSVEVAASADDGLAMLANKTFDVVLIDLNMPGKSGFAMMQQITETHVGGRAAFVAFTADMHMSDRIKEAGFAAILYKPVEAETLYDVISRYSPEQFVRT